MLGLVRSTDKGETWEPVSGLGKADYHELEVTGNADPRAAQRGPGPDPVLRRRRQDLADPRGAVGGRADRRRRQPRQPGPLGRLDRPGHVLSTNEGRSWRQRETTFGARIAWGAPDALYSAGKDGKVKRSRDGGKTFEDVGTIGAGPKELIVGPKGELYASVKGGEIRRSTDGGATWSKLITLASLDWKAMAFQRDGSDPVRGERIGRLDGEHRLGHSTLLASGTLACPHCDAPVSPGAARAGAARHRRVPVLRARRRRPRLPVAGDAGAPGVTSRSPARSETLGRLTPLG